MPVIKIKHTVKLPDFEQLYKELHFIIEHDGTADIELPSQFSRNFFSLTATLIQFIATWVRSGHYGRLVVNVDENDLSALYEQEYFFPIAAFVWNDVLIVNGQGESLRGLLRQYQNDFILKMRGINAIKGDKMLLVNLDHFDNHTGILPVFERKNEFITNEERLHDSLKGPVFEQVLKYAKHSKLSLEHEYENVAGIIYELMKNTFDWARDDENEVALSPNIRGMFMRFYKKKKSVLLEEYSNDMPIRSYFEDELIFQENEVGQIYFLEISVFDSGCGFIKKFVNDDGSVLNDIDIIKKCLIKNITSAVGLLRDRKGIGLDRILQSIDKKGFLRIKTDKYCLYRDMIKCPYKPVDKSHFRDVELMDWNTASTKNFTETYMSAGTSISILYPLANLYVKQ